MKIRTGQIWKRKGLDRYHRILRRNHDYDNKGFDMIHMHGPLMSEEMFRESSYINESYELVDPVMCQQCGTARARMGDDAEFAKGLLCWSCF